MRYSAHPSTGFKRRSSWRRPSDRGSRPALLAGALRVGYLAGLASCNDGYDNNCYSCNAIPAEVSLGVVAGNFNATA